VVTHSAIPGRIHGDTITHGDGGHLRPSGYDFTGDLMTQDQRLAQTEVAYAAVMIIVQVGSTDSAGTESNEDFTGFGLRNFALLDSQVVRAMNDTREHGVEVTGCRL
jgi:hypothetical protein